MTGRAMTHWLVGRGAILRSKMRWVALVGERLGVALGRRGGGVPLVALGGHRGRGRLRDVSGVRRHRVLQRRGAVAVCVVVRHGEFAVVDNSERRREHDERDGWALHPLAAWTWTSRGTARRGRRRVAFANLEDGDHSCGHDLRPPAPDRDTTAHGGTPDMASYSVTVTTSPAIKNAPLIGLAEGNDYFSNTQLAALVLVVPWLVKRSLPVLSNGGTNPGPVMLSVLRTVSLSGLLPERTSTPPISTSPVSPLHSYS